MSDKKSSKNFISRRSFLKSGMILTVGLPALRPYAFFAGNTAAVAASDPLFAAFQNPPVTAKPFVRWWWNGDKVTAGEILRELDVMKEAGIGGVEINPIAFPGGDDLGIPSLKWLSPEWMEMVKVALKGADERGMVCDIIVGSGWPFGAEFMQGDEQSQLITLTSRKVKGPATVTADVAELLKEAAPEGMSMYKGATSAIHSICLAPVQMDSFSPPAWLPFDGSRDTVSVDVPAGEHVLYAMVTVTGFQAVINGAPGAAGPVLNHYNNRAVMKFLNRMSDTLFPAIKGLKPFRAMFCDSMELEGANWCSDFIDEFKRRRTYDVTPYLPFILYKVGHMGRPIESADSTQLSGAAKEEVERVRYDFFITCMEIMRDRFLIPYTEWCNAHGFRSRVQTYGREFHPLEASMNIDIPECETWIWSSDGSSNRDFAKNPTYTNVNKFVASAAHYAGKKIVSCEESTNTSVVFNATLERIKMSGDMSNLSGVNHSILHGFNYTPLEAPFPGWIRYGMYLNERNLWWEYFKLWAAYKSRVSLVLQETEAFADIAVLHPLADMWTKFGTQRDPFPELHYPEYQYRVWDAIHKNGNSCDYTSEAVIRQSVAENGYLKYNSRKYHTLILLEVETMEPATAAALAGFAGKGGKVIFVGKEPFKSSGLKNYRKNDKKVAQTITAMKRANPSKVFTVNAPGEDIVAWFKDVQQQCDIKPYMRIDRPNAYVSQIRQTGSGKDIFFVCNRSSDERFVIKAEFPDAKGYPWLWNAETGERYRYPNSSGNTLTVDLPPASSQLIVFDTVGESQDAPAAPAETAGMELTGWTLRMEHINGTSQERQLQTPTDLAADENTRSFAGHLFYEKTLNGNNTASFNWLDLGKVYGVSEVTVNGEKLGCRWYGRHLYRIPEHLAKAASKTIMVKITTTLGNYFKSNPENKTGHAWTRGQAWQPTGMSGPVRLL
ncbi:MAG: hypothetical protein LBC19_08810 [Tannerella sp.]|jgi:hypothetical protein|nr:hypothetical protein [Tannerella sp.]